jgi:hypothetical protein
LLDLLRIKLHSTGHLPGGDEMIVTEGFEGTLLPDVKLHFAFLKIYGVGRAALGKGTKWS